MYLKILTWVIGVIYFYFLFSFIPRMNMKNGTPVGVDYYKGAIYNMIIYIAACVLYRYFYTWLEEFFIG